MKNYYFMYIAFGVVMVINALLLRSDKISSFREFIGFRTRLSTKNVRNRKFANRLYAKYSMVLGVVFTIVSTIFMLLDNKIDIELAKKLLTILGVILVFCIIIIIFVIQRKLKRFDSQKE